MNNAGLSTLSIVIPCFNEENTLRRCVENVLSSVDGAFDLEIIIVDDCSGDRSLSIARELEKNHKEIKVFSHEKNRGKGAALRTGFKEASGEFITVQDADLEYDPQDLKKLLVPLVKDQADVVLGSRFLSAGAHRVLYFWHYVGNRCLTLLSNMFTDLNLTDMETCYKVFKRDVIKNIDIQEDRFGFEPEIVAKIAAQRLRIFEIGVSYYGRTYEEGKKISAKDGVRALYCILRYSGHRAPYPIQFLVYLFIGGFSAIVNYLLFMGLLKTGGAIVASASVAFVVAAVVNYLLCIAVLFRHKAKWGSFGELMMYFIIVAAIGVFDVGSTKMMILGGLSPAFSKLSATCMGLILNFVGRRLLVFPEPSSGPWSRQIKTV